MSLLYHHRSACSCSQHLDLQQKAGAKRGHGLGRFLFSSGPEGFAADECMDYWLIFGPQYSRVGEIEGGHAGMAFLQFCFDSRISNKTS